MGWLTSGETSAAITSHAIRATAGQRPGHGSGRLRPDKELGSNVIERGLLRSGGVVWGTGSWSDMTGQRLGCSVVIMARSRELWLWAGASFVAAGTTLGGVTGALAAARPNYQPNYQLWSSGPMAGVYVACALGVASLWAAVRDWPFPFAADRSGREPDALTWDGPPRADWVDRAELAVVVSALTAADAGGPVALTTG